MVDDPTCRGCLVKFLIWKVGKSWVRSLRREFRFLVTVQDLILRLLLGVLDTNKARLVKIRQV